MWGSYLASSLSAELSVVAWSGKGLLRNYGEKSTTSSMPMPAYYKATLPTDLDKAWDFSSFVPGGVIINLGTNDFASGQDAYYPTADAFVDAYVKFAEEI